VSERVNAKLRAYREGIAKSAAMEHLRGGAKKISNTKALKGKEGNSHNNQQ